MTEHTVRFGDLLPDQPDFRNPGVLQARNVTPRTRSYGAFRGLQNITDALAARCLGAISARDASNNAYTYAGDASALYESVDNSFTDESKAGGYTTGSDDVWEFSIWNANNVVIATNYTDPIQSIAIGGGAAGAFADMITSTNTPKAKHVGIVGDHVVLGFTNDSTDGERPSRIWNSAIRDETDFDPSASTQANFADMATGGVIQRIIGGTDYGLAFQQSMVRVLRPTGEDTVFDYSPLNFAPGTPIPNSVISYKGNVFYITEAGFMALRGTQVQHIGDGRVDRAFWDEFDVSNKRYVSTAIDPINKIYAVAYPTEGTIPNRLRLCKYDELKWADVDIDLEILLQTETQGYTLDGLDSLGMDIDDASVFDQSLDSDKWKGGEIRFGAFDTSHRLAFFNGSRLKGTIETGDMIPEEGRNWQINKVRPLTDGGSASVSVASRQRLQDAVNYGMSATMNGEGVCSLRSEGRYQRLRTSLSGSFSHVQGLAVDYTLRGLR